MTELVLTASADGQILPGDFGIRRDNTLLLAPDRLFEVLARLNIQTVEELLSILQQFPTAVAEGLGWTTDQVDAAAAGLYATLRGIVPGEWLEMPDTSHGFGAKRPVD